MEPKWEVITFTRGGKDWFSVKNIKTGQVILLDIHEWVAYCDDFIKEGVRYGTPQRGA